ncbi:hypothetical protein N7522_000103 [Penicillium canescens]|uniref:uncharacterized protein n=1 Tax=Penicillium canescens TaxID=5083 RepID=UPI0026DFD7B2|nr:uncharacterized protein N7446_012237 [Penicillium canescens]KAJ6020028.1 hypothetical protein N7522_000103 [Penicillium canescens]KAJ6045373.1 hypothetical protein N7446_012237 [Penicillium canescens]KAJ6061067.1 hypothetical protein N7444_001763 [Penicillium canescens]KAJ6174781.1 hypothetical protein N7485_004586 [Penicillium canescens]
MAWLRSRIERDVTIEIGTMRDKSAQPVPLDVLMKWMETTMDIRGLSYPSHIIETEHGDLYSGPKIPRQGLPQGNASSRVGFQDVEVGLQFRKRAVQSG